MRLEALASLIKLAEKLKQQKKEASKIRRRTENQLKEAVQLGRRSSSGLSSLQKRIEGSREVLEEISAEFSQLLARKESIDRLIKSAQDRRRLLRKAQPLRAVLPNGPPRRQPQKGKQKEEQESSELLLALNIRPLQSLSCK